ncbi:GIY-YIG nuclease family protein [Sphingosinicella sp.]|uniref:GIY-YIG nuclease family protein n=1 Tax=Sphingosinicella sp. TaxID=1917971 RepID=UPI004037AF2B
MRDRQPCTYILASQKNGTLYVGFTSDLAARLAQHRAGTVPGFASRYGAIRLVHAEFHDRMDEAIAREKQLKRWHRAWKIALIEEHNPDWRDLGIAWGLVEPGSRYNK